jgi:hypothetical protein
MRQWQLAELLGATQPSVCMYERGVLPDAARLLTIARIGDTTVEWILTGRHGQEGPEEMERLPPVLYELARIFHEAGDGERSKLLALMDRIRLAISSIEGSLSGSITTMGTEAIAKQLRALAPGDRRALCAAFALQAAVSRSFFARGMRSLEARDREPEAAPGSHAFLSARSIVPLKGPLVRLDRGLRRLVDILETPHGRAELGALLERMTRRVAQGRKCPPAPIARKDQAARPAR